MGKKAEFSGFEGPNRAFGALNHDSVHSEELRHFYGNQISISKGNRQTKGRKTGKSDLKPVKSSEICEKIALENFQTKIEFSGQKVLETRFFL